MNRYKNLEIWKDAIKLAKAVHVLSESLPKEETYGLKSQMRRAAVSIASNIAEGAGRNNNGEFNQFLGIAIGSAFEVDTQMTIGVELGYFKADTVKELSLQIDSLANRVNKLQQTLTPGKRR
ncbi:MAG: four helix bundle protein [Flavobacteriales bacterium]|nr:four helix bundle protein [Flavobacteriales bacterium]